MTLIDPSLPDPEPAEPGQAHDPADGPAVAEPSSVEPRMRAWRLMATNPVTVAAVVLLAVVGILALFGPAIAPFGENEIDVVNALQPPSTDHWFGTDDLGRDVLSRVVLATGVSIRWRWSRCCSPSWSAYRSESWPDTRAAG